MRGRFCGASDLGRFILDLPAGKSIENTTFWSARVAFPEGESGSGNSTDQRFRDIPGGNPTAPLSERASLLRRGLQTRQTAVNPSPSGLLVYHEPIQYLVQKTGYYCVGMFLYYL